MRIRRFALLAALLCSLVAPTMAFAETVEWDAAGDGVGVPKGIIGQDGIACHGEATQDGHTYKYTNYIGADGDEMASNPQREQAWQTNYCRHVLETDMSGWFMQQHGITLDTSRIKMTIKHL